MLNAEKTSAQWTFNTVANNLPDFSWRTNGQITVRYSGERLNSSVVPEGIILRNKATNDIRITPEIITQGFENAFNFPIEKWFKAKVGVKDTIRLQYQHNKFHTPLGYPQQVYSFFVSNFVQNGMLVGSKYPGVQYEIAGVTHLITNETTDAANVVRGTLTAIVDFPKMSFNFKKALLLFLALQ